MNPTETHIQQLAKQAAALGEATVATIVAGVRVTIHSAPHAAPCPQEIKPPGARELACDLAAGALRAKFPAFPVHWRN
jgi:hypothetical protein